MLLPDNIKPENSIYYNGAFILKAMQREKKIKFIDLYQIIKEESDLSYPIFVLCIDWLFLIDALKINNDGNIELCS